MMLYFNPNWLDFIALILALQQDFMKSVGKDIADLKPII